MPTFRVTVRHGQPRYRYHVEDIEAPDMGDALAAAARRLPPDVAAAADVAEVRRLVEPEQREIAPA